MGGTSLTSGVAWCLGRIGAPIKSLAERPNLLDNCYLFFFWKQNWTCKKRARKGVKWMFIYKYTHTFYIYILYILCTCVCILIYIYYNIYNMNEWTNERTNERTNEWMNEWMNVCMYVCMYIYTHAVIYYAIIYYDLSQGEASCPSDLGVVPLDALPMVPRSQKGRGWREMTTFESD